MFFVLLFSRWCPFRVILLHHFLNGFFLVNPIFKDGGGGMVWVGECGGGTRKVSKGGVGSIFVLYLSYFILVGTFWLPKPLRLM